MQFNLPFSKKNLIFQRNEKSDMKSFLNFLEIFMNEIRKFEISIGEYEMEDMNIPSNNLRRERKQFLMNNLFNLPYPSSN